MTVTWERDPLDRTPRALLMSYPELFIEFFFGLGVAVSGILVLAGIALMLKRAF